VTVDSSVFAGNDEVGIVVTDMGTTATVTNSVLRDTGVGTTTNFGDGFVVLNGATASLASSFVRDNVGVGLAFDGSAARVDATVVFRNQIGVYVNNAMLEEVAAQPDTLGPGEVAISQSQFIDNMTRVSGAELPLPAPPQLATPMR
jgi:hypothetical protein